MDSVTQQNSALVEEASAAAESLQDQAAMLAVVVGHFKFAGAAAMTVQSSRVANRQSVSRPAAPARSIAKPNAVKKIAPKKLVSVAEGGANAGWQEF
ncbi:hypothetical protein QN362_01680 [Actimicrobium sp. CCC2.4]|nr:hypothetical protein [Actimicrobium sp. CCC2.4]MEB0134034.1 hypothetical protein [Actimicrobium sp. CCC2.4]WPX31568.1 hypothetical protein RHM62_15160 [Actimicrobium sp. CCC2.4]